MTTPNPQPNASCMFAADDDVPVPYMRRTRDWYQALGYNNPYRWAHFIETRKAVACQTINERIQTEYYSSEQYIFPKFRFAQRGNRL